MDHDPIDVAAALASNPETLDQSQLLTVLAALASSFAEDAHRSRTTPASTERIEITRRAVRAAQRLVRAQADVRPPCSGPLTETPESSTAPEPFIVDTTAAAPPAMHRMSITEFDRSDGRLQVSTSTVEFPSALSVDELAEETAIREAAMAEYRASVAQRGEQGPEPRWSRLRRPLRPGR